MDSNRPSFITLSSVLEGVGTSAYLAGAPLITSKAYLTVAGSILVTEALHTSYQRAAVGEVPMANPYGTVSPISPKETLEREADMVRTAVGPKCSVHPRRHVHHLLPSQ